MKCSNCQCDISNERIEGLKFLNVLPYEYTCMSCAAQYGKITKGFYAGLSGVSPLVFTDKLSEIKHISAEPELEYPETNKDIEEIEG